MSKICEATPPLGSSQVTPAQPGDGEDIGKQPMKRKIFPDGEEKIQFDLDSESNVTSVKKPKVGHYVETVVAYSTVFIN